MVLGLVRWCLVRGLHHLGVLAAGRLTVATEHQGGGRVAGEMLQRGDGGCCTGRAFRRPRHIAGYRRVPPLLLLLPPPPPPVLQLRFEPTTSRHVEPRQAQTPP